MRARYVGVDPHHDVAGQHVEAFPERFALAAVAAGFHQDLVVDEDRDAFVLGDLPRSILRARVDDDELVDERKALDEPGADRTDDLADRRGLVEGGKADRDTHVLSLLRFHQAAQIGELTRAERVLDEPFVDELAEDPTPIGTLLRKRRALDEDRRCDRGAGAHDHRVAGRVDQRVANRPERISRALAAGGAEDDRVVLGELLRDHAHGIAGSRDEPLHAFVVCELPEKLVQGRALPAAVALRDMEQRDRAVARPGKLDAEPRGELRVPAAADRHQDPARARRRALDDGDVRRRVAKDRFDRGAEQIPTRPLPADEQEIGPLVRAGLANGVPSHAGDRDERTHLPAGTEISHQRVKGAATTTRLGLSRRERGVTGHLDDRGEDDLAPAGQRGRSLEERALALGLGDRDEDLHAIASSTSGTTRSSSTRGHESARTRERKRAAGCSSARSTASAIASPDASGRTYVAASPASARSVARSLHTIGKR